MNLTVVAYYTRGTSYELEAALFRASVERLGLRPFIVARHDAGSWDANTAAKPSVIRAARRFHRGPILYVDVDAFVHEDPRPYLEPLVRDGVDFALHYFRGPAKGHDRSKVRDEGWWPLTGTIFVNDSPGAYAVLDRWIHENNVRRIRGDESGGGQRNLQRVLPELEADPGVKLGRLPGELCFVFDKPWAYPPETEIVIEHTIASRENRDPKRSLRHLVEARQARIRELKAELGS